MRGHGQRPPGRERRSLPISRIETRGVRRKQSEVHAMQAEQLQVAAANSRRPKQARSRATNGAPLRSQPASTIPASSATNRWSTTMTSATPRTTHTATAAGTELGIRRVRASTTAANNARTPTAPSGAATARPDSTTPARAATRARTLHPRRLSGQRPCGTAGQCRTSTASGSFIPALPAGSSSISSRGVAPQTLIDVRLYDPGTVSARVSARRHPFEPLQRGGRAKTRAGCPRGDRRPREGRPPRGSCGTAARTRPISNSAAICSEEASTTPCSSAKSKMPT